jgi:hypothetical protein
VTGTPIGRTPGLLEVRRLIVHADRVEQTSAGLFGLDVRRVSFDDLACASVQRCLPPWTEITLGAALALVGSILGGLGVWQGSWWLLGPAALAWAGVVLLLLAAWLAPAQLLVLHTPEQNLRTRLPRRAVAREEALTLLLRSVESHQRERHERPAAMTR